MDAASSKSASGSAERWGPLWGSRAPDWAASEQQQLPTYEEAIRRVGIGAGRRVLDIGCGTGVFLRAAADRGARVSGVDASEGLLEIARRRVLDADLRTGDMQDLPHDDDSFEVVCGFNSFFFAADMVAALREAGRVARPRAPVLIQVWGNPDRCSLTAMKDATAPFRPPPAPDAPPPPRLWGPGVLEGIATEAGLAPEVSFDTSWGYRFSDADALAASMVAAGGLAVVVGPEREAAVRTAIVDSLAPYRDERGGYRLENEWHYLVCRA